MSRRRAATTITSRRRSSRRSPGRCGRPWPPIRGAPGVASTKGVPGMTRGGLVIVDYGAGNLVSIRNALELLGGSPSIATTPGRHPGGVGHRRAGRGRQRTGHGAPRSGRPDRAHPGVGPRRCLVRGHLPRAAAPVRALRRGRCADAGPARGRRGGHRRRATPAAHRLEPARGPPTTRAARRA